jgi:hypothetical protein
MNNEPTQPTLIVGRLEFERNQQVLSPLHRQEVLLHQQRIAALIECARSYAQNPSDAQNVRELLRVASAFKDE